MKHATPRRHRSLPFAPLAAAISEANTRRGHSLKGTLSEADRRAYHRALAEKRITLASAEHFCDLYGWHPREIWGADGAWDQAITRKKAVA
jgi:hypothetical protein